MTGNPGKSPGICPPSVAVHNDGNMVGYIMGIDFYRILLVKIGFDYSFINYRKIKEKPTTDYFPVIYKNLVFKTRL
tara:strand:- start:408 stop:635 length:228 start_codon:yes stop_codon:yes gene_type:complete